MTRGDDVLPGAGVYVISNTQTGKVYVGSAVNVVKRFYGHREGLRKGVHANQLLQRAWIKYGEGAFTFQVVERTAARDLIAREQVWLDALRGCEREFGYNLRAQAASNFGSKLLLSEPARQIRRANAARMHKVMAVRPPEVISTYRKQAWITRRASGKDKVSPSTREKISAAVRSLDHAALWPQDRRDRLSRKTAGMRRTIATRECIRIARLGVPRPELVERMRAWNQLRSPEARRATASKAGFASAKKRRILVGGLTGAMLWG